MFEYVSIYVAIISYIRTWLSDAPSGDAPRGHKWI